MKKTYKIDLLPEDFEEANYFNIEDCPLARAMRRHFDEKYCTCGGTFVEIWDDWHYGGIKKNFSIVNGFYREDYDFVKEQYQDPNHDTIYFVTLKED